MEELPPPPTITDAEAAEIHAEISSLRDKVEQLMREHVTPTVLAVADRAEEAAHRATDGFECAVAYIREKPVTSVGIAAAAGYIVCALRRG